MTRRHERLVLASRSAIRQRVLTECGVAFDAVAADLDEDGLGAGVVDPAARAELLAVAKAQAVSALHPGRLVLGSDQVGVTDDGVFLEKPTSDAHHEALLLSLAGHSHRFFPAFALVKDGAVLAQGHEVVTVVFRPFSQETARRLVESGEGRGSCGGYESEHQGAQLIERIEGSYQAVLGLPMTSVLRALRAHGDVEGVLA